MYDLPFSTHRYYIEPLSGHPHMSRVLVGRYLSFIAKIRASKKVALGQLLNIVQNDVRMTTGANLRHIMMLAGVNKIEDLEAAKVDFSYHTVSSADEWKINFVKEVTDVKNDELAVEGWNRKELEAILEHLCSN